MSNIAAQIDINGNSSPSDTQINDLAFKEIRTLYAEGAELRIMRSYLSNPADAIAKAHFDKYNLDVSVITADAAAAKIVAADVRAALAFESAERTVQYWQRFADYLLTPTTPVDSAHLAAYHADVDPAQALIAAAPPGVFATVAQRATARQTAMVAMPMPFEI